MYWLLSSSIGRKFVMSVSGVFLVLFLLFHMSMNLVLVFSAKAYDKICEVLGANWYAIVVTLILAGGVSIHIIYGTLITFQNMRARGTDKYNIPSETKTEWAAQNMFVLGLIIILGLIIHLWNFWYKMQFAEFLQLKDAVNKGSQVVIGLFSNPMFSFVYILWLVALWFHLTHGIWSAFQTLGWNNKLWFSRLKFISNIVATIIMIGFAIVPIYFTFYVLMK